MRAAALAVIVVLAPVAGCAGSSSTASVRSSGAAARPVASVPAIESPGATSSPSAASSTPVLRASPACLRTLVIGYSVQRRAITACQRGTPGGTGFVVVGSIHGDEVAGHGVTRRLTALDVPAGVDLWVVQSANPDGAARGARGNAHAVDLNRNWPPTWQPSTPGTSTYSGPAALSEPETKALAAFLTRTKPRTVVVLHQPLDAVDFSEGADPAVTRYLAQRSGFPARLLGARSGSFTGWFNAQPWGGTALTFEFGSRASTLQLDRVSRAILETAAWRS